MTVLMDGKKLAQKYRLSLKKDAELIKQHGVVPTLAVLMIGEDPASQVYFKSKQKLAAEIGIATIDTVMPVDSSQQAVIRQIKQYNEAANIHGILVELPLPPQLDEKAVMEAIAPEKDVDGFHPYNIGRLFMDDAGPVPCTPAGIMALLAEYQLDPAGKRVVIIGRSTIVGRPLAAMLLNADATITITHSKTNELERITRNADILVVAAGQPEMITQKYIKPGAIVIDVGINRLGSGKIVGDVAQEDVKQRAGYLTPVPGGVGPMTSVMLMKQTLKLAKRSVEFERR
ncbi:bifunctional 5,10-methylene-tetrahydrofolate dehydrogenase / 5,10-methylene-tetrahydrofolate cyclohydrolase [Ligilactobacillus salitolerans]|uniref:Bifunctional protein FolD n=1 Tax=Ligilactobacillus salitolerans TaxID=1808352 RepID=A0A401IU64_9LACO|nr:bifunctional methylenetetrahydrofolate dehydrogenase/methenyltetrahydrofolate cyclohydrolase FolD [Ligilactobacillus salitolerans]GBG95069.1 bifunctional 5,10-methylene-tetrahydrofolate dehydrogenase / 5,10-methylene-tetrahydrofolate cyclohydrolase [Ligilactobacillus salitolerans]